jgi:hypothetical protein
MSRPTATAINAALAEHGVPDTDGRVRFRATDRPCEGAAFHSPTVLLTELVHFGSVEAVLCGTCRDNLRTFLYLARQQRRLDWPLLREFGNQLRAVGRAVLAQNRTAPGPDRTERD